MTSPARMQANRKSSGELHVTLVLRWPRHGAPLTHTSSKPLASISVMRASSSSGNSGKSAVRRPSLHPVVRLGCAPTASIRASPAIVRPTPFLVHLAPDEDGQLDAGAHRPLDGRIAPRIPPQKRA